MFLVDNGQYPNNGFTIWLDQNNATTGPQNLRIGFTVGNATGISFDYPFSSVSSWTNIVGTYDGVNLKLYINSNGSKSQ